MTEPVDDSDKIISYLDGDMSSEELSLFEERISVDSGLRNRIETFRISVDLVKHYGLTKQVGAVHAEMMIEGMAANSTHTKIVSIKKFVRYGVAVAASVLFIIAGVQGYRFYQLSPEKLYEESFAPYYLSTSRSNDEIRESKIESFYRQQKLDSVIKTAKKQVILSDQETLLTGIAYIQASDAFWAIKPLKKLSEKRTGPFYEDADFYLALAYLKNQDYDDALTVMQKIKSQKNHLYKNQFSDELLSKVKWLKWR